MAIYYELNGKTHIISLEDYLNLSDEKIQDMIASGQGYDINDPFTNLKVRDYNNFKDSDLDVQELSDEEIELIKQQIERDGSS